MRQRCLLAGKARLYVCTGAPQALLLGGLRACSLQQLPAGGLQGAPPACTWVFARALRRGSPAEPASNVRMRLQPHALD